MRRFLRRLFNNWPLKLAAVGLATLMYGGLALSQNTQLYPADPGPLREQPPDTVKLPSTPAPVDAIRYFAPSGVLVAASSFLATVDLADDDGKVGVFQVPISVTAPTRGSPSLASTRNRHGRARRPRSLEDVPVKVVHGPVPDGLTVGETGQSETATVTVSRGGVGGGSQVESVRADVAIQAGGIDVDQEVRLVPVDKLGNALSPVEVTPATARVTHRRLRGRTVEVACR